MGFPTFDSVPEPSQIGKLLYWTNSIGYVIGTDMNGQIQYKDLPNFIEEVLDSAFKYAAEAGKQLFFSCDIQMDSQNQAERIIFTATETPPEP